MASDENAYLTQQMQIDSLHELLDATMRDISIQREALNRERAEKMYFKEEAGRLASQIKTRPDDWNMTVLLEANERMFDRIQQLETVGTYVSSHLSNVADALGNFSNVIAASNPSKNVVEEMLRAQRIVHAAYESGLTMMNVLAEDWQHPKEARGHVVQSRRLERWRSPKEALEKLPMGDPNTPLSNLLGESNAKVCELALAADADFAASFKIPRELPPDKVGLYHRVVREKMEGFAGNQGLHKVSVAGLVKTRFFATGALIMHLRQGIRNFPKVRQISKPGNVEELTLPDWWWMDPEPADTMDDFVAYPDLPDVIIENGVVRDKRPPRPPLPKLECNVGGGSEIQEGRKSNIATTPQSAPQAIAYPSTTPLNPTVALPDPQVASVVLADPTSALSSAEVSGVSIEMSVASPTLPSSHPKSTPSPKSSNSNPPAKRPLPVQTVDPEQPVLKRLCTDIRTLEVTNTVNGTNMVEVGNDNQSATETIQSVLEKQIEKLKARNKQMHDHIKSGQILLSTLRDASKADKIRIMDLENQRAVDKAAIERLEKEKVESANVVATLEETLRNLIEYKQKEVVVPPSLPHVPPLPLVPPGTQLRPLLPNTDGAHFNLTVAAEKALAAEFQKKLEEKVDLMKRGLRDQKAVAKKEMESLSMELRRATAEVNALKLQVGALINDKSCLKKRADRIAEAGKAINDGLCRVASAFVMVKHLMPGNSVEALNLNDAVRSAIASGFWMVQALAMDGVGEEVVSGPVVGESPVLSVGGVGQGGVNGFGGGGGGGGGGGVVNGEQQIWIQPVQDPAQGPVQGQQVYGQSFQGQGQSHQAQRLPSLVTQQGHAWIGFPSKMTEIFQTFMSNTTTLDNLEAFESEAAALSKLLKVGKMVLVRMVGWSSLRLLLLLERMVATRN
ncbi:hypothetical protein HDU97_009391 [Phlyctochytrium planicorne]|nr:hypothetical protein HDU97_009391 [Phlyctochytrium planicorne]